MTTKEIFFMLSLSVAFPCIASFIAIVRSDQQKYNVLPILIIACLGLLTELAFYFLTIKGTANYIVNVEIVIEFFLIYLQVIYWRFGKLRRKDIYVLLIGFLMWLLTTVYNRGFEIRNAYFFVIYSFILVITGIDSMNELLVSTKNLLRNHQFIFALAIILFYTYSIIVESICLNYTIFSKTFINNVFYVKCVLNVNTNILFSIALLCVPKKQTYSLSFS